MKNKDISIQIQILLNHFNAKNFIEVINKGKILLKKNPEYVILYNLIGSAYQNSGAHSEARGFFEKGLKLDSNNIPEAKVCEAYEYQEVALPHDGQPGGEIIVDLQASCSSDGDGYSDSLSFTWSDDHDNQEVGTSDNISISLVKGLYTYTVEVSDCYGESDSDEASVWVRAEENYAPLADAGQDTTFNIEHDGNPGTDSAEATICGTSSSDT